MPWYWWGSSNSASSTPEEALNPELKEFLKEQSPRPYQAAEPPKPKAPVAKAQPEKHLPDTNKIHPDRPVPAESLFPDGRYAHLWKTYTPSAEINAQTLTPVDRITQGRKDRTTSLHRAALENCAFEDEVRTQCLAGVNMASRFKGTLTMCGEESRAYTRCYQLQAKFLQALGYMSSPMGGMRDAEHEERIQMHADKLYHRMMDYEAAVAHAKAHCLPIPPLTSVFDASRPAPTADQIEVPENLRAKMSGTPLHELPPQERELAARAALTEAKIKHQAAGEVFEGLKEMNEARMRRQAMIARFVGEPIAKFVVPDADEAADRGKT
ncbi:uncharacterized protein AB675_797 [Cyphellophora attinorum]|uniref:Uncharacterized protein n=1 Tax=Cyphellophora attinorum TaxID=1664694 RepID=A0A0N1HGS7_9EURO|nr:uncharacterized protein AB675_797 [Phialophora attinorum]KPI45492.1 hypothetical protein AB675_797 [Phialophora attinorum]